MTRITVDEICHWAILGGPDINDIRVGDEITISLIDERDPDGHPQRATLSLTDLRVHCDAAGRPLPSSDYWLTGDLTLIPSQGWMLKQVQIRCRYTRVGHFTEAGHPLTANWPAPSPARVHTFSCTEPRSHALISDVRL